MRPSRLGRGLDSLIHAVEEPTKEIVPVCSSLPTPLPWPVEHPSALTPTPLRLDIRSRLEKLSTRPRIGLKAARAYLDHLRQVDGRTSIDLTLSPDVDLTDRTMLNLRHGRISTQTRYQFFGVSIWLR